MVTIDDSISPYTFFYPFISSPMKRYLGLLLIPSLTLLILTGCAGKNIVRTWDIVTLIYTATFSDWSMYDQNSEQNPLVFKAGAWQVVKGLDEGIIWAKINEQTIFPVTPEKWLWGLYQATNIQKIPQLIFDKQWLTPEQWKTLKLWDIEGVVKWTEKDADGNTLVIFDVNPRQTWDTVTYAITVLSKK